MPPTTQPPSSRKSPLKFPCPPTSSTPSLPGTYRDQSHTGLPCSSPLRGMTQPPATSRPSCKNRRPATGLPAGVRSGCPDDVTIALAAGSNRNPATTVPLPSSKRTTANEEWSPLSPPREKTPKFLPPSVKKQTRAPVLSNPGGNCKRKPARQVWVSESRATVVVVAPVPEKCRVSFPSGPVSIPEGVCWPQKAMSDRTGVPSFLKKRMLPTIVATSPRELSATGPAPSRRAGSTGPRPLSPGFHSRPSVVTGLSLDGSVQSKTWMRRVAAELTARRPLRTDRPAGLATGVAVCLTAPLTASRASTLSP